MNITVYCGANIGNNPSYRNSAIELGAWIADNGHTLIYGGGNVGLMGILADTVLEKEGKAIGIMPKFLKEREIAHKNLTEFIVTDSMTDRKKKMIELGDAYIALPGGPGTMEEISEAVSWSRIGQHSNPCIYYNVDDFYNPVKILYENMVSTEFLSREDYNKVLFSDSISEISRFIETYIPPKIRKYK